MDFRFQSCIFSPHPLVPPLQPHHPPSPCKNKGLCLPESVSFGSVVNARGSSSQDTGASQPAPLLVHFWKPPAHAHSRMDGLALLYAHLHILGDGGQVGTHRKTCHPPTLQGGHNQHFCNVSFLLQNSPPGVSRETAGWLHLS